MLHTETESVVLLMYTLILEQLQGEDCLTLEVFIQCSINAIATRLRRVTLQAAGPCMRSGV